MMAIPKIAHFVWFGWDPLGSYEEDNIADFQNLHPDWEINLWSPNNLPPMTQAVRTVFEAKLNPIHRSNIARLLVIWNYGGLYADCDFRWQKNIDALCDRELLLCEAWSVEGNPWIGNYLFAAEARHPFFAALRSALPGFWQANRAKKLPSLTSGSALFGEQAVAWAAAHPADVRQVPKEYFTPFPFWADLAVERAKDYPDAYAIHDWQAGIAKYVKADGDVD
jgi:mannosyltransferase OCH1-like enzyme